MAIQVAHQVARQVTLQVALQAAHQSGRLLLLVGYVASTCQARQPPTLR